MAKELRTIVLEDAPVFYEEDAFRYMDVASTEEPLRTEQRRYLADDEDAGAEYVQAFINNISFPKSLEELEYYINEVGEFDLETLFEDSTTEWTAPRWAKAGDIVFFMHAKYAKSTITRLRTALRNSRNNYSQYEFNTLSSWINHGLLLHDRYGGKIVAVARVSGPPTFYPAPGSGMNNIFHWTSREYAEMNRVTPLKHPISLDEFSDFIRVSRQGAITPVFGEPFNRLRSIIQGKNRIPRYLAESISSPIPLSEITKENWITLPAEYRRRFLLESQFRSYYVDHLLHEIKDKRTRTYSECRCKKTGIPDSFVDNVIVVNGKYLPVEVKLSVSSQSNILAQVSKYSYDNVILCENKQVLPDEVYSNRVLVIDTDYVYMYDADANNIAEIFALDNLKSTADLQTLKRNIQDYL